MERYDTDIYEALKWLSTRVKMLRLSEIIGKSSSWLYQKQNNVLVSGRPAHFTESDLILVQQGWDKLALILSERAFLLTDNLALQLVNWKGICPYFTTSLFYETLGVTKSYFENRTCKKHCMHWRADQVAVMNECIQSTAAKMRSTRLVLPKNPSIS